jgi:hypothetical protein
MPKVKFLEFRSRFGSCRHFTLPANIELEKVARNLLDNYDRIAQSLAVPGSMVFAGLWTEHEWFQATLEVKGAIGSGEPSTPGEPVEERIRP